VATFSDDDRAYLDEMRAISTDAQDREVLVGLTSEETDFYLSYTRDLSGDSHTNADTDRYLELHDKHEAARLEVLAGENQLRNDNPPLH
jgi:hypothetical protein